MNKTIATILIMGLFIAACTWEDLYLWVRHDHGAQAILATLIVFAGLVINEWLSRKQDKSQGQNNND